MRARLAAAAAAVKGKERKISVRLDAQGTGHTKKTALKTLRKKGKRLSKTVPARYVAIFLLWTSNNNYTAAATAALGINERSV